MTQPFILVAGPLPPPVHGAAKNTMLIARMLQTATTIRLTSTSADHKFPFIKGFRKVIRYLSLCVSLADNKCHGMYLCFDGGSGRWLGVAALALARLINKPVFLHHRSFAYIDSPAHPLVAKALTLRNINHIFLSAGMEIKFTGIYGAICSSHVVSNFAFSDILPSRTTAAYADLGKSKHRKITVGFLSNLCQEKGLDLFLEIVTRAIEREMNVRFILAGRVLSKNDKEKIDNVEKSVGTLKYIGPVYGKRKKEFYDEIDLFFFPSKYANEAEPNVIIEAISSGVPVISTNRGCVKEMIADSPMCEVVDEHVFVQRCLEVLASASENDKAAAVRGDLVKIARQKNSIATAALNSLIDDVVALAGARSLKEGSSP